jgi:plastocyanin
MKARLAAAGTAIGCAIAVACLSERGAGPGPSSSAECSVPVSVIDSMHIVVAIRDFTFQPDSISVPPGATVTWVNCEVFGTEPHTTTADGAEWDSPELGLGNPRFSHTFPAPGAFPYHCDPHPFMLGKVVVE